MSTHAVRAAPLALRSFIQLRIQTHQVVGLRTRVTQDDLTALLAHLAVILVVSLNHTTNNDVGNAKTHNNTWP